MRLRCGIETEFSEKMLLHLRKKNESVMDLIDYLNKFEIPTVHSSDFTIYGNEIAGKTFYHELLLLGFCCIGIRDWECALDGDDGYWWDDDMIKYISRQLNQNDPYEISEFLGKRESELKKKYKSLLVDLL